MSTLCLSFFGLLATAASPMTADSFGYARSVDDLSGAAVEIVELPVELYRESVDGELDDLRVYNAEGAQVPYAIRRQPSPSGGASTSRRVPHFPLRAQGGVDALSNMRLEVTRDEARALLQVAVRGEDSNQPGTPELVAYLIELGHPEGVLSGLEFELSETDAHVFVEVTLEVSDDLVHWQTLPQRHKLVRLAQGQHRIERTHIPLPGVRSEFIRLSWSAEQPGPALKAVQAHWQPTALVPATRQLRLEGRAGEGGAYDFDLGGVFAVERLSLQLPNDNTLARATLRSYAELGGPARRLFSGIVYRVRTRGELLTTPSIKLARGRSPHRYFGLEVEARGGGLGSGLPSLVVDYRPQQLLFMARGPGPFQVAYGRYGTANAEFDPSAFESLLEGRSLATAKLGPPRRLKGPAALLMPAPPTSWRSYILWTVLLLGVAMLGLMARRLVQAMANEGD